MPCKTCGDLGLVRVNWCDAEHEFAICLCPVGMAWRNNVNAGRRVTPHWRVWASIERIDPSRIHPLEDVLTPEELAERGFTMPTLTMPLDAIAAAAKGKRGKL